MSEVIASRFKTDCYDNDLDSVFQDVNFDIPHITITSICRMSGNFRIYFFMNIRYAFLSLCCFNLGFPFTKHMIYTTLDTT